MATKTIGSGGDYATIADWVTYLQGIGTLTETETGELLPGIHAANGVIFNSITTATDKYVHLTSHSTARHTGLAAAVSGLDTARINGAGSGAVLRVSCNDFRMSWLEMHNTGDDTGILVYNTPGPSSHIYIHHNIIHNDARTATYGYAIRGLDSAAVLYIYRNIIYGMTGTDAAGGIAMFMQTTANGCLYYNNVVCLNGLRGISWLEGTATVKNNICIDNVSLNFRTTDGQSYNISGGTGGTGPAAGTGSTTGLTLANTFVAAAAGQW